MNNLLEWCDKKISYLKESGVSFRNGYPIMPEFAYYTSIAATINPFANRNEIAPEIRSKSLLCFFSKDERLLNRLYKVDEEIPILKQYGGICGFDLSPAVTMLRPRQRLSLLISAVYNCYVALHGVKVLPNCRVGDLANMSIIDTILPCSNIITGEIGCHDNALKAYGLYQLKLIIKKECPPIVFVYGSLNKKDIQYLCGRREQTFVFYPDRRHRMRDNKTEMAVIWDGLSCIKTPLADFVKERGVVYGR